LASWRPWASRWMAEGRAKAPKQASFKMCKPLRQNAHFDLLGLPGRGPNTSEIHDLRTHVENNSFSKCARRRGQRPPLGPPGLKPSTKHHGDPRFVLHLERGPKWRRRLSAQISVVIHGLVLRWASAPNRKTRRTAGLKVAVSMVSLWGPRGPPRGCPESSGSPPGTAKHDGQHVFYEKLQKLSFVKMCTPLQCQAHCGEPGVPPGPRNTTDSMFL
jgi:hypothetical protein